ncbi:hypothetical protein [Aquimarina sp. SS2-1]|uniref:hypothetical protein n=1 Tax=Aquimarina besae TaxID=3342247 RepID=UPI00366E497F
MIQNSVFIKKEEIYKDKKSEVENILINKDVKLPDMIFKDAYSNFSFCDFEYLFSEYFFESLKKYLNKRKQDHFTFYTLDPDPENYFFKNFGSFNIIDFSEEEYSSYIKKLSEAPDNNEADALIYNSNKIIIYAQNLDLVIYGDRNWEIAVICLKKENFSENNLKTFFENDVVSVEEFVKMSSDFYDQLSSKNLELESFYKKLIDNYN